MKRMQLLLWLLAVLLCGCAAPQKAPEPLSVTLLEDDAFTLAEGYAYQTEAKPGAEVRFVLRPEPGFVLTGTDCQNVVITDGAGGSVILIVKDVQYPTRIRVLSEPDSNFRTITYDLNGGRTADGASTFTVRHALNGHLYPNTDPAIGAENPGCTLIGWNTERDGAGEHIGLGSRCRTDERELTLYAEWLPWTDGEQFTFCEENGGLIVTAYTGTEPVVCVPAEHNGLPVTAIAAGAFTEKELACLSLPNGIERIEPGTFTRCAIQTLYFFDTVTSFPDAAFSDTPYPAVHLLAAQPPRYAGSGRASNYADKIDLLYRHRSDRKIVVFGGSGTYYSVLAGAMQQSLSDEYVVLNMGINGWFPAIPQLDVIRAWMQPGDILLHIPEMASGTQLFSDIRFALPVDDPTVFDDRYLRSLELNYDLIADMDLNETEGFFDSFTRFNKARKDQPPTSYSDYSHYIDGHGDFPNRKLSYQKDEPITHEADICPDFLTEEALARMNAVYNRFAKQGVKVCLAFAAVNENGLMEIPAYREKAEAFEQLLRDRAHAAVLGTITDAFYPGSVFYNSDWHLSEEADRQNTDRITAALKDYLTVWTE